MRVIAKRLASASASDHVPFYEAEKGAFVFKPRSPGGAVWIDEDRVSGIEGFSYSGSSIPNTAYATDGMVTDWDVFGPLTQSYPEVETRPFDRDLAIRDGDRTVRWSPLSTKPRGALLTGKVTHYEGSRRVAYFQATVRSETEQDLPFGLGGVDDLALWINGRFEGFLTRSSTAWWDFRFGRDRESYARRLRGALDIVPEPAAGLPRDPRPVLDVGVGEAARTRCGHGDPGRPRGRSTQAGPSATRTLEDYRRSRGVVPHTSWRGGASGA